ncbi:CaiB/BaiF CoA-transferase family protein [Aliiglaciecola sp. LCG003]|uniref:CaiB/BaiF CoA transferase family protein n=1 Tax=Aliiglaciecola sp. LCG003 TaxID=3053655 RepID=UPI0025732CFD|nr:CaiB/BaiF CoA-transferase family protein [Aliiglaciecola sp. LCG003]WJG10660.1 CaiB/BaiF CoA-transferase family protein [Aliiglaciecola sp. LCG003]
MSQLKVLDFSTLLPGPYATMILADMGAAVIRVESPTRPDLLRVTPPMFDGRSYAHLTINRNKRSLALNLKSAQAQGIIHKLIQSYDVLIEQFRPGVMARLGLDYETLKAINPKLIYCSITGYGQTGPYKDKAGHDINYLALSGLASYSGKTDTGPVLSGTQVADLAGGSHHAVMAILAAVIQRQQEGEGSYVDISMLDCAFAMNGMSGAAALATGQDPQLGSEILNGGIFYDYYPTSDGQYLSVGGLEPQFAQRFFTLLEHPEWLMRCTAPAGQQGLLKQDLANLFASHSLQHWLDLFAGTDVCVEPVLSVHQAAQHPQLKHRNMVNQAIAEDGQFIPQIRSPLCPDHVSASAKIGRCLGQDSIDILKQAGIEDGQISSLLANGDLVQHQD